MINVAVPVPPGHYESRVKQRGQAFLATTPNPTKPEWRAHRYWREIHNDLYQSLSGICSYCATYTPRVATGGLDQTSIDHFIPKSKSPPDAYEWTNFRLCRGRLNHRKDDFQDVLDPYVVQTGSFRLNFGNFLIFPDPALPAGDQVKVDQCLKRLQLNTDDDYVNERARAVYGYAEGKLGIHEVKRFYPFIASEIDAQDFDNVFLPRFQQALAAPQLRAALVAQGILDA